MADTGREFMERTKFEHLEPSDQMKGVPHPPLVVSCPPTQVIELPDPAGIKTAPVDLRFAIEERRSIRQYTRTPLTLDELSFLLWCTQGVRENVQGQFTFRNVPSAGARHALETFVLANHVEGLHPGLYLYCALDHRLAEVTLDPDIGNAISAACIHQQGVVRGAATFIWTAVAYRMTWRYGERGYRYLHLDAGHVCQNLYLAARAVDCGVCAIGAFHDDVLNALLGIDGTGQFVVYLATLGKVV